MNMITTPQILFSRPIGIFRPTIVSSLLLLIVACGFYSCSSAEPTGPLSTLETQPGDAPREVKLSDGTKIWLRENSRLAYPESFAKKSRQISLTGEAYFDVAEDSDAPFRVALPGGAEVEVLGTRFLVNVKADSSADVTVFEGSVTLNVSNKVLILPRGKAGTGNPADRSVAELNYRANAAAWHNNTLIFEDQPMASVVRDLEDFFEVDIYLRTEELLRCRFDGRFPDADLKTILDAMEPFNGVIWNELDNEYQLWRKSPGQCS